MTAKHDITWYESRIAYMERFMTPERAEVLRRAVGMRTRWMSVCMENTFHPQNASALVRDCEAFGVQDIHTIQTVCRFNPNVRIVRGTDKWIDLTDHASTVQALTALRARGYRIVATSPRGDTTPERFDVRAAPFCLFFGTEHAGVSDEVIEAADTLLAIPMCGMVESLNVSASAAILLYELSSRLRAGDTPWRLTPGEQAEVLLRWMMGSVKDSERILEKCLPALG
jgi:tRNA (guanosine-2'-O-)-methyltransferase